MRNHRGLFIAIMAALLLALAGTGPVAAQDGSVSDDEVNEVAKEVYCPVCESTPLDVCQTKACADWRELIRTKLGEGQTKEEIFQYFADQYGDRVLASPPRQGFNLILWIFPVIAVIIGLVIFSRYLRGLRLAAEAAQPAAAGTAVSATKTEPNVDDNYINRIEKELSER